MNRLDEWLELVCRDLGLDPGLIQRDLLLDLTREVAHEVARPAAPLTAYLVGLSAGRSTGDPDVAVGEIMAAVRRVTELAAQFGGDPGDAERPRGQSPGIASG